jgi:hypothetical protein
MTIRPLRQEAKELRPIKRRVSAVCVANLNNPEISGHSIHTFWPNYNPGRYNLSSYLASLVQKAFVASRLGERWAARQSSLLKSVSCRLGRRFRIFLFRTSQSLHRRGVTKWISDCWTPRAGTGLLYHASVRISGFSRTGRF